MLSPNSEQIENAAETLENTYKSTEYPTLNRFMLLSQLHELDGFGPGRLDALRKALSTEFPHSLDGLPDDFRIGYLLGVQTARMVLSQSVTLALASVKAADVL